MAIVVIGGHGRNVGKTSVVAGLIAAIPERHWTAVKISPHEHSPSAISDRFICTITEERDPAGARDTCRFLRAGAQRALWVRIREGRLREALPALTLALIGTEDAIFESNRILEFIRPDVYLQVLNPAVRDFKNSAREFLPRADAIVLGQATPAPPPSWENVSPNLIQGKPIFHVAPPGNVTPELTAFVRGKCNADRS